ncbi:MauE/DoxX family redox-associated membrane protein [Mucilaginibacter litoreus]|uniref:MauE/DoxX family redox-associated membrane protein n=1 Tax=Mucilaginibacter litoreus TaxID=1048221 RepID=A0ABW3AWN3_9SPHI
MRKDSLLKIIAGLIAAMFFYAAVSKLTDFSQSRQEMRNQVFPVPVADVLLWVVPLTELNLSFLLVYQPTRLIALYASLVLLCLFSIYITITMTGIFGRVPCSCGGILKHMSYGAHLIFNLFFIGIAIWGIAQEKGWSIHNRRFNTKGRRLQAIE